MKIQSILAIGIILFLGVLAGELWKARVSSQKGVVRESETSALLGLPQDSAGSETNASNIPQSQPSGRPFAFDPNTHWRVFRNRFGSELQPLFRENGQLERIQGKVGMGQFANPGFHPDEPQLVIPRAQEILSAATQLIGSNPEWPIENPLARCGKVSAQVFFNQTHQGIPIAPSGNVKIDLGPQGELLGFYSDYVANVQIRNSFQLNPDQARQRVASVMTDANGSSGAGVEGGGKVIWVKGTEGRYAFQFTANGVYFVVDAETGKILFQKDRKVH